jgi:ubiquinone/menaquinone biosynthesis C-methylase UbiE
MLGGLRPASLASIAQFLGNQAMREPYDRLADVVRAGRTVLPGEGSVEPENPIWVQFAETMAPMMAPMAGPLGAVVLQGHAGPMRVLDIAAGHGLFGIEIAKQNPEARVTGLDWAPVLRVALDNARRAGVHERYDMLPGSAFEVDFGGPYDAVLLTNSLHHFGGPYDAVLLTNSLHHFDQPTCVGLLQKVHRALRPGGRVATLEFVPNEDRVSPPMPAAFAMTMLTTTAAGDAYTLSELTSMYGQAGFGSVTAHPIPMSPHTIVMGRD